MEFCTTLYRLNNSGEGGLIMTELEGIQGVVCAGRNRSIIEGIDVLTGIMQQEGYSRVVSEFRKQFPEVDRKGSGDSQLVALDERDEVEKG